MGTKIETAGKRVFQPHRLLLKRGLGPGALPYPGEAALSAGGDLSLVWAGRWGCVPCVGSVSSQLSDSVCGLLCSAKAVPLLAPGQPHCSICPLLGVGWEWVLCCSSRGHLRARGLEAQDSLKLPSLSLSVRVKLSPQGLCCVFFGNSKMQRAEVLRLPLTKSS